MSLILKNSAQQSSTCVDCENENNYKSDQIHNLEKVEDAKNKVEEGRNNKDIDNDNPSCSSTSFDSFSDSSFPLNLDDEKTIYDICRLQLLEAFKVLLNAEKVTRNFEKRVQQLYENRSTNRTMESMDIPEENNETMLQSIIDGLHVLVENLTSISQIFHEKRGELIYNADSNSTIKEGQVQARVSLFSMTGTIQFLKSLLETGTSTPYINEQKFYTILSKILVTDPISHACGILYEKIITKAFQCIYFSGEIFKNQLLTCALCFKPPNVETDQKLSSTVISHLHFALSYIAIQTQCLNILSDWHYFQFQSYSPSLNLPIDADILSDKNLGRKEESFHITKIVPLTKTQVLASIIHSLTLYQLHSTSFMPSSELHSLSLKERGKRGSISQRNNHTMDSLFGDEEDEENEETDVHQVENEQTLELDSLQTREGDGREKQEFKRPSLSIDTTNNHTGNSKKDISFSNSISFMSGSKTNEYKDDEEESRSSNDNHSIFHYIDTIVNVVYDKNGDDWNAHSMSSPNYFLPQKHPFPITNGSNVDENLEPCEKIDLTIVHLSHAMFAKRVNRENLNVLLQEYLSLCQDNVAFYDLSCFLKQVSINFDAFKEERGNGKEGEERNETSSLEDMSNRFQIPFLKKQSISESHTAPTISPSCPNLPVFSLSSFPTFKFGAHYSDAYLSISLSWFILHFSSLYITPFKNKAPQKAVQHAFQNFEEKFEQLQQNFQTDTNQGNKMTPYIFKQESEVLGGHEKSNHCRTEKNCTLRRLSSEKRLSRNNLLPTLEGNLDSDSTLKKRGSYQENMGNKNISALGHGKVYFILDVSKGTASFISHLVCAVSSSSATSTLSPRSSQNEYNLYNDHGNHANKTNIAEFCHVSSRFCNIYKVACWYLNYSKDIFSKIKFKIRLLPDTPCQVKALLRLCSLCADILNISRLVSSAFEKLKEEYEEEVSNTFSRYNTGSLSSMSCIPSNTYAVSTPGPRSSSMNVVLSGSTPRASGANHYRKNSNNMSVGNMQKKPSFRLIATNSNRNSISMNSSLARSTSLFNVGLAGTASPLAGTGLASPMGGLMSNSPNTGGSFTDLNNNNYHPQQLRKHMEAAVVSQLNLLAAETIETAVDMVDFIIDTIYEDGYSYPDDLPNDKDRTKQTIEDSTSTFLKEETKSYLDMSKCESKADLDNNQTYNKQREVEKEVEKIPHFMELYVFYIYILTPICLYGRVSMTASELLLHRLVEAGLNRLIYHLGNFAPQGFTQADTRQLHSDFLCIRDKIIKEQRYQHPKTKMTADLDVFSRLHAIISTLSNSSTLSRWCLDDILAFQLLPDRSKWVGIREDGGKLRNNRGTGITIVNSVIRRMSGGGASSTGTNQCNNLNNRTNDNTNLSRRSSINFKNQEVASRRHSVNKGETLSQEKGPEAGLPGNSEQNGTEKVSQKTDQKNLENDDSYNPVFTLPPLSFRLTALAKLMTNREEKVSE